MTSVKLINHSSSTADWNYIFISIIYNRAIKPIFNEEKGII